MLFFIILAFLLGSFSHLTSGTPPQNIDPSSKSLLLISSLRTHVAHELFLKAHLRGSQATVSTFMKNPTPESKSFRPVNHRLASVSGNNLKLTSGAPSSEESLEFPTSTRLGLNGDSCTSNGECAGDRSCIQTDANGTSVSCNGDNCLCLTANITCTTGADCDDGETCITLTSGAMACASNVVLAGDTLDFLPCSSSAECATGRSCFGTSLTAGVLDCSSSSCSCVNVQSNCNTFEDCLVGTSCTRISPEIPASFCVANSLIVGNFPSGLTQSNCTLDTDCAAPRSCLRVDEAGDLVPCAGGDGCACAGGTNLFCASSRFCDFGETCALFNGTGLCAAVTNVI